MQQQQLKIDVPEGYEIDGFDKASGVIKFKEKPKKITDRVKSLTDAMQVVGSNDPDVSAYKVILAQLGADHHLTGYQAAIVIAKALNEGWTPDWSNSSEYKYYAWFEMRGSSGFRFHDFGHWDSHSGVGSRLCFKSRELAQYAGKEFQSLFEQFMVIK